MEFLVTALIAACVIFVISKAIESTNRKPMHCMTCGAEGYPVLVVKGSIFIELLLWIIVIAAGLTLPLRIGNYFLIWICITVPTAAYSIWRVNSRYRACGMCKGATLVPPNTPAAIAQKKQLSSDAQ